MAHDKPQSDDKASALVSFDGWLKSMDRTRATGWRWRKAGIVQTINIFSKHYISREEIARFEARAAAGEFSREARIPARA